MYTLFCAFLVYTAIMFAVVYMKPACMYDADKKRYRPFGTDTDSTLFPLWACAVIVAIGSYIVSLVVCTSLEGGAGRTDGGVGVMNDDSGGSALPSRMKRAAVGGTDPRYVPQQVPQQVVPQHVMHHPHRNYFADAYQATHPVHHTQYYNYHSTHRQQPLSHLHASRVWKDAMP